MDYVGFRVWALGLRFKSFGPRQRLQVQGLELNVEGLEFRAYLKAHATL